jgi:uncharacterized protein (DUF2147 family)
MGMKMRRRIIIISAIRNLLFIAAIFMLNHAGAQTNQKTSADAILRVWETEEKDGRIEFLKSGNGYYGKILYGKQQLEADGKTYKKDIHNPDPVLRTRLLMDYVLITGLIYKDGKWVNGKIYNFNDGNSYDISMELKDSLLYLRVFKGLPMFGKTLKWHPLP